MQACRMAVEALRFSEADPFFSTNADKFMTGIESLNLESLFVRNDWNMFFIQIRIFGFDFLASIF